MSNLKRIVLVLLILAVAMFSAGCVSAYDVAVNNGFEGTEAEWLESLKGADGTDGKDLSITEIYAEAQREGYDKSYLEFIKEYMSFTQSPDHVDAATKGLRSAVIVYCSFSGYFNQKSQAGAGVIYKLNGQSKTAYILTNYHVVYNESSKSTASDITISPYGGEEISATFVGGTADYDIAVLKATDDYFATEVPLAVTVSESDAAPGQTAIAIGNPEGIGISVTQGIISTESEEIVISAIDKANTNISMRVMRIDAAVNSGNSGGGLFDSLGELIGIVNAKLKDSSVENIAYAIPVSAATAVADNIIKNGRFNKGTVGISLSSKNVHSYLGDDGIIRIAEDIVVESATGAASGILIKGDIIRSIIYDGVEKTVNRSFHLTDALLRTSPGDKITFKVERNSESKEVTVTCT